MERPREREREREREAKHRRKRGSARTVTEGREGEKRGPEVAIFYESWQQRVKATRINANMNHRARNFHGNKPPSLSRTQSCRGEREATSEFGTRHGRIRRKKKNHAVESKGKERRR